MSFSVSFFIGCVIACIFFQLGMRIGSPGPRPERKNKKIRKAKIQKQYSENRRLDSISKRKNVYNIEDYRNRENALVTCEYSLIRCRETGEFFKVPKEFGNVLKSLENKNKLTIDDD